jgi:hypothetical protein
MHDWYVENHAIMVNKPEREWLGEGAPETVCEMNSSLGIEETKRNAVLIAQAPELLRVLEYLAGSVEPFSDRDRLRALDVIARAKGGAA